MKPNRLIPALCLTLLLSSAHHFPTEGQTTISISGTVKNRSTGIPIQGAEVLLEGTTLATASAADGRFNLVGQMTGTLNTNPHSFQSARAEAAQKGILLTLPSPGNLDVEIYSLKGAVVASIRKQAVTSGQWLFSPEVAPGTYVCRASINATATTFRFHSLGRNGSPATLSKIRDIDHPPQALAKSVIEGLSLAVSKSGFMMSRTALSSGVVADLTVLLDTIQFTPGMSDHQAREMLGKLMGTDSIIFIKRFTLNANHYYTEHVNSDWLPGGNICILNLKNGVSRDVITDPAFSKGVIKRFDLSHDGSKVVFDFKKSHETGYRLYETDIATGTVRQITFPLANEDSLISIYKCKDPACGDRKRKLSCNVTYHHGTDDFEPCYLPDGGIVFASTRCQIGTPCNAADCFTTTNIYRVDRDGRNLRRLSYSMASELTPTMMPDGRILYARWEYVDKASAAPKCIWTMYPNGAGSSEVYKNTINVPPTFVQPRAIPGVVNKFVVLATAHCCYQGQYGTVIRLNMDKYIRSRDPMEIITKEVNAPDHTVLSWPLSWGKGNTYRDPYPLAEDLYLVSHKPGTISMNWWDQKGYGLYVLTGDGTTKQLYRDNEISCWQPMPLKSRPKEPLAYIPLDPELASKNQAVCTVNDVYFNMEMVERGSIKYLRILEQVPRPWSARRWWTGDRDNQPLAHAPIARNAGFGLKAQWGIVPVESDGSASFYVPANRAIFFHALDSNFQVVQHERTYVNYMPGERRGCVGCHETPDQATPLPSSPPLAFRRAPSVPGPQPGDTTGKILLDYEMRVQPVWDKHCVSCHNSSKNKKGNLDLSGTHKGIFSVSYDQLMNRRNWLLGFYIDELPRNPVETTKYLPAYTMFSNCILLKMIGVPVTLRNIPGAPVYLAKWATKYAAKADLLTKNHESRFSLSREETIRVSNWIQSNLQYRGTYWGRFNSQHKGLPDYRPAVTFEQATGTEPPSFK